MTRKILYILWSGIHTIFRAWLTIPAALGLFLGFILGACDRLDKRLEKWSGWA